MNVLLLFDGISCARVALERAGIKVDNYYASEIDKWAKLVSYCNYEDIDQVGDVTELFYKQKTGGLYWGGGGSEYVGTIDLLIGGSPCQGFSFAGKQLNFEDPRSKLFFEYVRILREVKPKYFILENVPMKKEYQDIISKELGVEPIMIDAALVSAQRRKRLFWTNIPGVTQPEDQGILLKDIVHENCFVDREKSYPIIGSIERTTPREYFKKSQGQIVFDFSVKKFNIHPSGKGMNGNVYSILNEKSACLTTNKGEGQKIIIPKLFGFIPHEMIDKIKKGIPVEFYIRKLTPIECERLQGLPDGYTEGISNSQRYRCLGNAFNVDVIAHILSFIKHIF